MKNRRLLGLLLLAFTVFCLGAYAYASPEFTLLKHPVTGIATKINTELLDRTTDPALLEKWNVNEKGEQLEYKFSYTVKKGIVSRYAYRISETEWETCDAMTDQYRMTPHFSDDGSTIVEMELTPIQGDIPDGYKQ